MSHFNKISKHIDNENTLSIFHSNIRYYKKNFDQLTDLLTKISFSFDVIGFSETWDNDDNKIILQKLTGYHELEKLPGTTKNAGVAVYVKENLIFNRRDDLSFSHKGMKRSF